MLASVVGLYALSARRPRAARATCCTTLTELNIDPATQKLAVPRVLHRVRDQGADVAGAHLAARRRRGGQPGAAVLLVGVLDKIGTFGMIRLCLRLFPEASQWATPVVMVLAVSGHLRRGPRHRAAGTSSGLIAYSSVCHFGFIVLGIFALTSQGQTGRRSTCSTTACPRRRCSWSSATWSAGAARADRRLRRRATRWRRCCPACSVRRPVRAALPGLSPFVSEFLALAGTFSGTRWRRSSPPAASSWLRCTC